MGIVVESMFDGMSCAQIALERAGIEVDKYYASEIEKRAIEITQRNYPNTVQQGTALNYAQWNVDKIDLMVGGSPCQDLSRIKSKDGRGLDGEKSKLFYTLYNALERFNPRYFLVENVVMKPEDERMISGLLGVDPVLIDSGHFSAQNRPRLYWTNIPFDKDLPENNSVLSDVMETQVDDKYYYTNRSYDIHSPEKRVMGNFETHSAEGKRIFTDLTSRIYNPQHKCATLTAVSGGHHEKKVYDGIGARKLTPLEYERLQTVPDGYTVGIADGPRYKMLGNGWTVDVIAHIFKGLREGA